MKNNQYRNKRGQFTPLHAPFGHLIFLSKTNVDKNSPYVNSTYGSGYYIVTGANRKGVITCIPAQTVPSKLHKESFLINSVEEKTEIKVSLIKKLGAKGIRRHIQNIKQGILDFNEANSVYKNIANEAIAELQIAATLVSSLLPLKK